MNPFTPIIRAVQTTLGLKADGDAGELTWKAIYQRILGKPWTAPEMTVPSDSVIPAAAIKLILESEGVDQPGKWPGGGSGITLGFGCDIGADPSSLEYWRGILADVDIERLATAKGKVGRAAAQIQTRFEDIRVTRADSLDVFMRLSLPREVTLTRKTYPGIDRFPSVILGVMVSITYNRGTDLDWDKSEGERRLELRTIHNIIKSDEAVPDAMRSIAAQVRQMKRLWVGKGLDGLLTRRDAEANMIIAAIPAVA